MANVYENERRFLSRILDDYKKRQVFLGRGLTNSFLSENVHFAYSDEAKSTKLNSDYH
jgi:hypothetical protein